MNLYQYIQRKDEIKSKIDELPTAYSYAIVSPDYVNKYSEFFEYMSDITGIELVKSPVYVKEGDIIEPEHFLNLCDNTRHLTSQILFKIAEEPIPELGVLSDFTQLERFRLSRVISKIYDLLNTIYSYGLLMDRSNWIYLPLWVDDFNTMPSVGETYSKIYRLGEIWVENSKLMIPTGSYMLSMFVPKLAFPNIYFKVDLDIDVDESTALLIESSIWVGNEGIRMSNLNDRNVYWCVEVIESSIRIWLEYYADGTAYHDTIEITAPSKIYSIEVYIHPLKIKLLINNEEKFELDISNEYDKFTGGYTCGYIFFDNHSETYQVMKVDRFKYENIVAKHNVEVGTPVFSDEWNKLKNSLYLCNNKICMYWDKLIPRERDIFVLDNFDDFPSSTYWDRRLEYSGNVYVSNGKLIVDGQSYIYLERSVNADIPIRIGLPLRFPLKSNANISIHFGLRDNTNTLWSGLTILISQRWDVDVAYVWFRYRDRMEYLGGWDIWSELEKSRIMPNAYFFKDVVIASAFTGTDLKEYIVYTPTEFSKFVLYITNDSDTDVKAEIDYVAGYKYGVDSLYDFKQVFE
ncbi:MAG: hypothetical protein QW101_07515 [Ignisphaera sp.]